MDEIGGHLPREGKPSRGRRDETGDEWASATAGAAAVRGEGCDANGFSISAVAPHRSLEDRGLPGHVADGRGGHVWGSGRLDGRHVAWGKQIECRKWG